MGAKNLQGLLYLGGGGGGKESAEHGVLKWTWSWPLLTALHYLSPIFQIPYALLLSRFPTSSDMGFVLIYGYQNGYCYDTFSVVG